MNDKEYLYWFKRGVVDTTNFEEDYSKAKDYPGYYDAVCMLKRYAENERMSVWDDIARGEENDALENLGYQRSE